MSNWRSLPISERYNTWKLYREAYPEMSHRDMIKHFNDGGTIGWPPDDPPTTQDSLNLYNNTNEVLNYYKNYDRNPTENYDDIFGLLKTAKDVINKRDKFEDNTIFGTKYILNDNYAYQPDKNSKGYRGILVDKDSNLKMVPYKNMNSFYYNKIDENKFKQRDITNNVVDLRSPMVLYDKRIKPNYIKSYVNHNTGNIAYGDVVEIPMYDPIAVKPVSMLTPSERKLRESKYGPINKQIQNLNNKISIPTTIIETKPISNNLTPQLSKVPIIQPEPQSSYIKFRPPTPLPEGNVELQNTGYTTIGVKKKPDGTRFIYDRTGKTDKTVTIDDNRIGFDYYIKKLYEE